MQSAGGGYDTRGAIALCHGQMPLLGAIAGGGVSAHVGGLDVPSDRVPLLGAMVRCHCWGGTLAEWTCHLIGCYFVYVPWNFLYNIRPLQCSFTNPKYDVMELET